MYIELLQTIIFPTVKKSRNKRGNYYPKLTCIVGSQMFYCRGGGRGEARDLGFGMAAELNAWGWKDTCIVRPAR